MSEPMYRDWILETIDSLRSRKARPDLERICRMVRRRHGSDPERTRSELEKLIQEQTVLKVSYKGSISYRNAAKVQRKSRKKTEQTTGVAVKEQTKHIIFNSGDSAHSSTDKGKTGDAGITNTSQCHDPKTALLPVTVQGDEVALVPNSGNSCLSCDAVICQSLSRCATGSGVERTNSPKNQLPQTGSSSSRVKSTANNNGSGASDMNRGAREVEVGLPGLECSSTSVQNKTCTGANISGDLRQKPHAPIKPKPRAGAKGGESESDPSISDLGDRLVESVRSLVRKSRGVATFKGHAPLGLKEILSFLSSQERLSQEKLTRNKVKVVLEREVARGRLRRTRFGNITLPVRGVVGKSTARLLQSALQDRQTAKKETGAVAMETDSSEFSGRVCGPQSAGDQDSRYTEQTNLPLSKDGEAGGHSETRGESVPEERPNTPGVPATMHSDSLACAPPPAPTCDCPTGPAVELAPSSIHTSPKQEMCDAQRSPSAHRGLQGDAAVTEVGIQLRAVCPSAQRGLANGHEEPRVEESAVTPDQLISDCTTTRGEVMKVSDGPEQGQSVSPQNCVECKIEVGMTSCLLTPTASPRDLGVVEEGGMKRGVFLKSETAVQRPLEWSVSDVASYFIAAGFPEQAAAFRAQEIDGKSLLLMQRNDVLTGLSIRLGPALKIYEHHVKVLQKTHFEDDGAFC
ncbi:hypothetical protein AGOR_G00225250 [Albula goreensis]|uniref:SAM domain-containing protein n=1 Tax=Albula goreensis TaxID=1534307 RepID=A0A8T3CME6_9TELE|nr:hypothetical protein AGOR_G00225250 [Albula goreensis]